MVSQTILLYCTHPYTCNDMRCLRTSEIQLNYRKKHHSEPPEIKLNGSPTTRDLKKPHRALAGVAQWIECWPGNQWVTDLIPSQGVQEATTH